MAILACACGCGELRSEIDTNGCRRVFVNGHNTRKYASKAEFKLARKTANKKWKAENPAGVAKLRRAHYRRRKLKAMAFLGNRCARCDTKYDGTNAPIFEFDHKDPAEKDAGITRIMASCSWEKVKVELKKCQLLCANCHNIKHGGNW
jgi:hypothetical protein